MHKTARLVVLIEPELLARVKKAARDGVRSMSTLVRESLVSYLEQNAARRKTRRLKRLGRYRMPLRGIEDVSKLNEVIAGAR